VQLDEKGLCRRSISVEQSASDFALFLKDKYNIREGTIVAYSLVNSIESISLFLGLQLLKAIACPLNYRYRSFEIQNYIEDLEPSLYIVSDLNSQDSIQEMINTDVKTAINGSQVILGDLAEMSRNEKITSHESGIEFELSDSTRIGLLLHTGGTTGKPKVVPISTMSIRMSMNAIHQTYMFSEIDKGLLVMPLFHVHGLLTSLAALINGKGAIYIQHGGEFSASKFYNDCCLNNITWYTAVPSIHEILMLQESKRTWEGLRFIRSCSSALGTDLKANLRFLHDVPIIQAYGMTEACHQISSQTFQSDSLSVGLSTGDIKIAIKDDYGSSIPTGIKGRVCIKGDQIMKGYLKVNNQETFSDDGYFFTGDLGYITTDNELVLVGRDKEMINCGGEKINPEELESSIRLFVPDIKEVVAFGSSDDILGEVPCVAVVCMDPSVDSKETVFNIIERSLKGKISKFKLPKKVYLMKTIPLSSVGKLQRLIVKKACEEDLIYDQVNK